MEPLFNLEPIKWIQYSYEIEWEQNSHRLRGQCPSPIAVDGNRPRGVMTSSFWHFWPWCFPNVHLRGPSYRVQRAYPDEVCLIARQLVGSIYASNYRRFRLQLKSAHSLPRSLDAPEREHDPRTTVAGTCPRIFQTQRRAKISYVKNDHHEYFNTTFRKLRLVVYEVWDPSKALAVVYFEKNGTSPISPYDCQIGCGRLCFL